MEWNHQPFYGLNPACGPAERLSEAFPEVRVDLYNVGGMFDVTPLVPDSVSSAKLIRKR